jgi:hypothetical protein
MNSLESWSCGRSEFDRVPNRLLSATYKGEETLVTYFGEKPKMKVVNSLRFGEHRVVVNSVVGVLHQLGWCGVVLEYKTSMSAVILIAIPKRSMNHRKAADIHDLGRGHDDLSMTVVREG